MVAGAYSMWEYIKNKALGKAMDYGGRKLGRWAFPPSMKYRSAGPRAVSSRFIKRRLRRNNKKRFIRRKRRF